MKKASILYDSHCKICNAEIEYYKKKDPNQVFEYLDIMDPEFDSAKFDLKKEDVHKYFHVIDKSGKILVGVEAFDYIWKELGVFRIFRKINSTKIGNSLMNLGYRGFIKARPYLPRKEKCDDDYCQI